MKNFIRIRVISIIILFAFMFSIASVGAESITYGKRNVYAMEENGGLEPQEGEEDENSSKIPETLTPVNEEQETNGEIAEPDEEQESNSGESGLVDEEVVPEDEEKSDVQDEEQDNEQNDAQNDGQNDEQNNEIVVPLESLPDSSKDLILPSASLTENAGIRFFGFQYIHVNQSCTDLYEQYIQFEESITGKVHIRLLDDEGNTVAISDEYELINSTSFYSVLYKIRYFTEGKYYLEVIKDGDSLNGESLYEVTVTDSPILTGVYTSPLDGKQPVTGSTELHFQVDAYGVDNPEDLVITILEPDGNNGYIEIGQSVQGRIEQKFYTGKVTLKYKVKLKDNEFLKDEYGYKVKINRNDGEELFSIANIIDVYTDKYPYIYNINIIDGAAGKVILKTQNISNGEYRVVFNKLGNGWQVVDTVEDASSYCNLGVLEVQLMDDGIPAYLEGRYNIEILDGEEFVSSSHISINYSSEYFSDYYSGPAILDVTPSYVKGTAEEQIVQVAAKMINITPENAKIELIEVDKDGKFLAVAGSIDDLNFIKLSEPHGYKFDNMYTVRGGISLSGLDTSKQYRWRISFKDRNNGDRIIVYSNPVKISQVAIADKLRMINVKAVAQQQEMHETGGQFMYPSMYLIAAGTDKIDFAIDSAFNMEDISKINVQLKDSTGTVYGNLKANSLIVQGTMIEGSVNVVVPL
ncbi:MAG: hypothetical protein GYA02_00025, partial [Clostridiaceae bacterium]|nr:hypothetical protein [Clostridiaceae bacterium]